AGYLTSSCESTATDRLPPATRIVRHLLRQRNNRREFLRVLPIADKCGPARTTERGTSLVRAFAEKQSRNGAAIPVRIFQSPLHASRRRLPPPSLLESHRSSATMTSDLQIRCSQDLFCAGVLQYFGQRSDAYLKEQEERVNRRNCQKLPDRAPPAATKPLQPGKAKSRCG